MLFFKKKIDDEAPKEPAEEKHVPKMGMFEKLTLGLHKTKANILGKLSAVFSSEKIDGDTLDKLEEALYTSDIGVKTTEKILEDVRKKIGRNEKIDSLKDEVRDVILSM
ncbi:MAG TPA: signal recognition particle receptor subunit alpha, partial [Clostridiales bacterium]|nr:signal recognition particle receptor subunit alpha [Clostridiales bacterium]